MVTADEVGFSHKSFQETFVIAGVIFMGWMALLPPKQQDC